MSNQRWIKCDDRIIDLSKIEGISMDRRGGRERIKPVMLHQRSGYSWQINPESECYLFLKAMISQAKVPESEGSSSDWLFK